MATPIDQNNLFLKCSICSYPLSIIPIFYHPTLGSICGRCENIRENIGEDKFERQILLEIMVKNLIFPCAYKKQGCLAELNGNEASIHEQSCLFKVTTVLCPLFHEKFFEICTWIGDYKNLSDHIRQKHEEYFKDSLTFVLTPELLENKIIFSENNGSIIMVLFNKRVESNSFICWIMSDMNFKECLEKEFEISFSAENSEKVVFSGDKLEQITPSTRISSECNMIIPISSFNHLFNRCNEVTVSIAIFSKGKISLSSDGIFDKEVIQSKPSEVTTLLLKELECPMCTELMGPPIYMCTEGHNLCFCCRNKILECPICRGNILGGRNLSLEELCSVVSAPCVYRKDGCSFVNNVSKVKEHEPFCYIAIRSCLMNSCEWFGRTIELPEHLEEEHTFKDIAKLYSCKRGMDVKQHLFLYDDKIFLLDLYIGKEQSISYSVRCFGEKTFRYKYEIELMDPSTVANMIVLKNDCQPVGYNFNRNSFITLTIPVEMLDSIIKDRNEINFRLNISEISN